MFPTLFSLLSPLFSPHLQKNNVTSRRRHPQVPINPHWNLLSLFLLPSHPTEAVAHSYPRCHLVQPLRGSHSQFLVNILCAWTPLRALPASAFSVLPIKLWCDDSYQHTPSTGPSLHLAEETHSMCLTHSHEIKCDFVLFPFLWAPWRVKASHLLIVGMPLPVVQVFIMTDRPSWRCRSRSLPSLL